MVKRCALSCRNDCGQRQTTDCKTRVAGVGGRDGYVAPVAVRLPEAVPLVPATIAADSDRKPESALSCPATVEPTPARAIAKVGFDPLDVTVTLPLALAAAAGVKVTVKLVLCPALSLTGVGNSAQRETCTANCNL